MLIMKENAPPKKLIIKAVQIKGNFFRSGIIWQGIVRFFGIVP